MKNTSMLPSTSFQVFQTLCPLVMTPSTTKVINLLVVAVLQMNLLHVIKTCMPNSLLTLMHSDIVLSDTVAISLVKRLIKCHAMKTWGHNNNYPPNSVKTPWHLLCKFQKLIKLAHYSMF